MTQHHSGQYTPSNSIVSRGPPYASPNGGSVSSWGTDCTKSSVDYVQSQEYYSVGSPLARSYATPASSTLYGSPAQSISSSTTLVEPDYVGTGSFLGMQGPVSYTVAIPFDPLSIPKINNFLKPPSRNLAIDFACDFSRCYNLNESAFIDSAFSPSVTYMCIYFRDAPFQPLKIHISNAITIKTILEQVYIFLHQSGSEALPGSNSHHQCFNQARPRSNNFNASPKRIHLLGGRTKFGGLVHAQGSTPHRVGENSWIIFLTH